MRIIIKTVVIPWLFSGILVSCQNTSLPAADSPALVAASVSSRIVSSSHSSSHSSYQSYVSSSGSDRNAAQYSYSKQDPSPSQKNSVANSLAMTSSRASGISSVADKALDKIPSKPVNNLLASVSGVITILGKNGEALPSDNVIVNLIPLAPSAPLALPDKNHPPEKLVAVKEHEVHMIDKAYTPNFLTIRRDEAVTFINSDKIKHNVFSTSPGNSFDLGTYGKGSDGTVALKNNGIVKVYCNIHPNMAIFVSVSDDNYSFITSKDGIYSIGGLPPGEYMLTGWNIRGEAKQKIVVAAGKKLTVNIQIDTASYVPALHKNKYGEMYKIKSALFDDEFY